MACRLLYYNKQVLHYAQLSFSDNNLQNLFINRPTISSLPYAGSIFTVNALAE